MLKEAELIEAAKAWNYYTTLQKAPITKSSDIPDFLMDQIKEYVDKYSPKKLSIWGSYSTGMYHNRLDSEEFLEAKKKAYLWNGKGWKPESDLDLIDCSFDTGKRKLGDLEVHAGSLHTDYIIYDNGKFI